MIAGRLYAASATLAAPGLRWMLARRVRRGKEIAARLDERFGIDATPRPAGRLLWLHAASVGETMSVLPVLTALARMAPDATVLLTTGTVTSATTLARRLPGYSGQVLHRFVPLDVPAWVARFLDHWRPDAAAFVESEIWPNVLAGCAARGVPTMLVNARLSARSFGRWRRAPGLARALFGGFARVQAQSAADAERLAAVGAPVAGLIGNLKFAADPLPFDAAELRRLEASLGGRNLWLAACVHPGEEAAVRTVQSRLAGDHPGLLAIVVPRHPERGPEFAGRLAALGVTRRGAGEGPPAQGGVWIADTLGELGLFYRLVGHAFVGRSLGAKGGQNPIEPARLGCAVAVGPDTQNFADVVAVLERAGALTQVADAGALAGWVDLMLRDPAARARMGAAGIAAANRGAELPGLVAAALVDILGRG